MRWYQTQYASMCMQWSSREPYLYNSNPQNIFCKKNNCMKHTAPSLFSDLFMIGWHQWLTTSKNLPRNGWSGGTILIIGNITHEAYGTEFFWTNYLLKSSCISKSFIIKKLRVLSHHNKKESHWPSLDRALAKASCTKPAWIRWST